jgi:hypothetical protein
MNRKIFGWFEYKVQEDPDQITAERATVSADLFAHLY